MIYARGVPLLVCLLMVLNARPETRVAGGAPAARSVLRTGTINVERGEITLPLLRGRLRDGRTVWYILTDVSDRQKAQALRLNWSPKLAVATTGRGPRIARRQRDGTLVFDRGAVDFFPPRRVIAGDPLAPFPPRTAEPGSVASADYTPLMRIEGEGDHILNAPIVAFDVDAKRIAFCDGNPDRRLVHDRVRRVCPRDGTVTIGLTPGFSATRAVLYLSTESTDPAVAALEAATYAPGLRELLPPQRGASTSSLESIFVAANGQTGRDHPQRQGMASALADRLPPLNVLRDIPPLPGYSPMWDVHMGVWTDEAIRTGRRARLTSESQFLDAARNGHLTGPQGARFGPVGVIVNCLIAAGF